MSEARLIGMATADLLKHMDVEHVYIVYSADFAGIVRVIMHSYNACPNYKT